MIFRTLVHFARCAHTIRLGLIFICILLAKKLPFGRMSVYDKGMCVCVQTIVYFVRCYI